MRYKGRVRSFYRSTDTESGQKTYMERRNGTLNNREDDHCVTALGAFAAPV